jgi:hypothetical protein
MAWADLAKWDLKINSILLASILLSDRGLDVTHAPGLHPRKTGGWSFRQRRNERSADPKIKLLRQLGESLSRCVPNGFAATPQVLTLFYSSGAISGRKTCRVLQPIYSRTPSGTDFATFFVY